MQVRAAERERLSAWRRRPLSILSVVVLTGLILVLFSSNSIYRFLHQAYAPALYNDRVHAMSVSLRHALPIADQQVFVVASSTEISRARRADNAPEEIGNCAVPDNRPAGIAVCLDRMSQIRVGVPVIIYVDMARWSDPDDLAAQSISYALDPRSAGSGQLVDLEQVRQTFLLNQIAGRSVLASLIGPTAGNPEDGVGLPGADRVRTYLGSDPSRFVFYVRNASEDDVSVLGSVLPDGVEIIAGDDWNLAVGAALEKAGPN